MSIVISFSGAMGTGKSTVMSALEDALIKKGYITTTLKFAEPLYSLQDVIYNTLGKKVEGTKDRELLQWLGSDWGKAKFGPDVWATCWLDRVKAMPSNVGFILNDDMRFPNELAAVRKLKKAITIRLVCPDEVRKARIGAAFTNIAHISETALNEHLTEFDMVFDTNQFTPTLIVNSILAVIQQRIQEEQDNVA